MQPCDKKGKTPRQTTLDEFTGGVDVLLGTSGVTVRKEPHQPRLFDQKPTQLVFAVESPSATSATAAGPGAGPGVAGEGGAR